MLTMVEYVHQRIKTYPRSGIGVDMTMGNGYDTLMLSHHCQEVYSFDIQKEALHQTQLLLGENSCVHLILDGHQHIDSYLTQFDIGIFNLGYLPLGNHQITTLLPTTKIAIEKAIHMFQIVLFIVVYPGHAEGYQESLWIDEYMKTLDTHMYNVSCYRMMNKKNAPYVIEIEKRKPKNQ